MDRSNTDEEKAIKMEVGEIPGHEPNLEKSSMQWGNIQPVLKNTDLQHTIQVIVSRIISFLFIFYQGHEFCSVFPGTTQADSPNFHVRHARPCSNFKDYESLSFWRVRSETPTPLPQLELRSPMSICQIRLGRCQLGCCL